MGCCSEARRWQIAGRVQGVGFRPFVFRLAISLGLTGWVQNRVGQVEIHTEGKHRSQELFAAALTGQAPAIAEPRIIAVEDVPSGGWDAFTIRDSEPEGEAEIHLPPDFFTCDACLRELEEPEDRRYHYPFINCTQCGPRYTLIRSLPYDRRNTSMSGFPLCPACLREYQDLGDRRFHAEPVACPLCGPNLELEQDGISIQGNNIALDACLELLTGGRIVAVKGVGGYHLMCDARDAQVVERLRRRKPRPDKPLAVMFPAPPDQPLAKVEKYLLLGRQEAKLLLSPARPIVLLRKRPDVALAPGIAPGLDEIGVMLPYTPLHHLLLSRFEGPLVATSANISGEPVLTENRVVSRRLRHVAEAILHHDRPIVRPADDPVFRRIGGEIRPLRLGRGVAPLELMLPLRVERPVLAAGGHMKNTLALAWGQRVVVSPHIGDMESARSLQVFEQVAADLQTLYGVEAETVICDYHPGYATSRWAGTTGLPVQRIWHHAAHASAVAGERGLDRGWLVFTWDGVGLGRDGTLWGGEALSGRPGRWQRVASLRPFRLPGGDKAAREPWRSALAVCWESGLEWQPEGIEAGDLALLHHAWKRGINAPATSAAGRLFDAVAALTGVCTQGSYEGQGPMQLEASCQGPGELVTCPLARSADGLWVSDWQPLVKRLLAGEMDAAATSACLHNSLVEVIVQQALKVRTQQEVVCVGLAGGVFQNRILTERAMERLREEGFETFCGQQLPMNDAGLSFGQVIEFAASRERNQ